MWHASYLAAIGDWHVGIRSDDPDVTRHLELLLGDVLTESTEPPSGYAVVTQPRTAGRRAQPLGELRHGPQVVLCSRYPSRLAAAAASHVLALGHSHQPVLRLAFSLVARDAVGIMVHPSLLRTPGLEPLLVRAGWDVTDAPEIAVSTDEVPVVDVISWLSGRSETTTDRVTLRSMLLPHSEFDHGGSRSAALAFLMASSPPSALPPQAHLDRAARLARQLVELPGTGTAPRAVAAALERSMRRLASL